MKNGVIKKSFLFLCVIIMAFFLASCELENLSFFDKDRLNLINTDYSDAFDTLTKEESELLTAPQAAAKVLPSVVSVLNYAKENDINYSSEGSGIIMSADGYIITNAHVIEDAGEVKVIVYNDIVNEDDDDVYTATGFWHDSYTDLGLIKINATNLPAAEFGTVSELAIAEDVLAIGNPGGTQFHSSVTKGIVSYVNRSIEVYTGYSINCIQTDAAINPGNSGGALVNMYGQVIGINSSKIASVEYEGMGFAISIQDALPIISALKENGGVSGRPAIGITYQLASYRIKENGVIKSITGLQIAEITNSALSSVFEPGDIITQIDEQPMTSSDNISAALNGKAPGSTITVKYYRLTSAGFYTSYYNAESHTATITLIDALDLK